MRQTDSCAQQLEQLEKDFEEFAYIVSHDFKAPIRAISNLSNWIEEDLGDNLTGDVQDNMQLLRNRANRLERMIESLLIYSRVARADLSIEQMDVAESIKDICRPYQEKLSVEILASLPVFYTYKTKLAAVFQNIISNAVAFSNKEITHITVSCQDLDSDFFEFRVMDNGGGVPESALSKIFTLFYTVLPKDNKETTGAGLAITKKIIQFVQGSIYAEQHEKEGLTIKFTWPKTLATV